MPSTYSSLKIQLMATGENNTTWGDVTNLNLGTALEEAIVGSADVAFSNANVTLTLTDTNASQTARNMRLNLTGTATSGYNLVVPSIEKPYIINNGTDGTITVKNATGTGIAVPAGKTMWVYNDGTNVVDAVTRLSSLTLGSALAVGSGGTGANTLTSNGVLLGNGTSAISATAAGTTGQVLVGNTGGAPTWATLSGIGVTSFSAGTTGLTPNSATTGAITLAGTLNVANGGTGATSLTSGYLVKGNGTSAASASVAYDDGTSLLIGKTSVSGLGEILGVNRTSDGTTAMIGRSGGTNNPYARFIATDSGCVTTIDANGSAGTPALALSTNSSEVMRLVGGNVGIGTTSPGAKLEVAGSSRVTNATQTNSAILITSADATGSNGVSLEASYYGSGGYGPLKMLTGGTERMRIDSSGNVAVGTSSTDANGRILSSGSATQVSFMSQGVGSAGYPAFGFAGQVTPNAGRGAGMYLPADGTLAWSTAGSERMRIDSSGNVGIGTSSPGYLLHLNQNGNTQAWISATNAGSNSAGIGFENVGQRNWQIWADRTNDALQFGNNSRATVNMVINSSGNVGIGTSSPAFALDVATATGRIRVAPSTATNNALFQADNAGGTAYLGLDNSGGGLGGAYSLNVWHGGAYPIVFATNNSEKMRITSGGDVGIGTSSPSQKLDVNGVIKGGVASGVTLAMADNSAIRQSGTAGGTMYFDTATGGATQGAFEFRSSNAYTSRMYIDSSGNVGIGTTSPAQKLHVATTAAPSGTTQSFLRLTGDALYGADFGGGLIQGTGPIATISTVSAGTATERMRIDSSGNVGIGTSSPGAKLDVVGVASARTDASGGNSPLVAVNTNTGNNTTKYTSLLFQGYDTVNTGKNTGLVLCGPADANYVGSYLAFQTRSSDALTERMRIDSAGNLLVGTTSVGGARFVAVGTSSSTSRVGIIRSTASGDTAYAAALFSKYDNDTTTSQVFVQFSVNNDGTASGQINANGASQAAFGSWSDARLKENVSDLPSQWEAVKALRPVEFDYIEAEGGGHQVGFIAQEVQEVYPDVVGERGDGMLTLTGMGKGEARLIKALQEAILRIEELTARVAQLEGN